MKKGALFCHTNFMDISSLPKSEVLKLEKFLLKRLIANASENTLKELELREVNTAKEMIEIFEKDYTDFQTIVNKFISEYFKK